ncbi:MAG: hypothetical protein HZB67_00760 [Candidatus Aenigmarchaeota archaeon]|nr:hypothetical protein [Candidatus Aenigmarchaeota archaeon]
MPLKRNYTERKMLAASMFLIGAVLVLESVGFLIVIEILRSEFMVPPTAALILWLYSFIKIAAGLFSSGFGFFLYFKT